MSTVSVGAITITTPHKPHSTQDRTAHKTVSHGGGGWTTKREGEQRASRGRASAACVVYLQMGFAGCCAVSRTRTLSPLPGACSSGRKVSKGRSAVGHEENQRGRESEREREREREREEKECVDRYWTGGHAGDSLTDGV